MIGPTLVVLALVVVPGSGAALAFAQPGEIPLATRFALVFGFGYAVAAGLATLLALTHVLSRDSFVVALVVVTAAIWALVSWRSSFRAHAAALAAEARRTPFSLGAGLLLVLAVAASRPFYPPELTLAIRSAWRYWADGLEVAAAGHFPATTHQWGFEFPATVSKAVLNAFEGGTSLLAGPDPLGPMQGILTVAAIGLVASLFALGRELGLAVFAPVLPVLVFLVPVRAPLPTGMASLDFYIAENVGRFAAFSAMLAGIVALRSARPKATVLVAGSLLAVAGLTHLIPTVVAFVMLACYGLGTALVQRGRVRAILLRGAGMIAVFAVIYASTLVLSGGDLGWQSAEGQAFRGFPANVDPTESFNEGRLVTKKPKHEHFFVGPKELLRLFGSEVVNRPAQAVIGLVELGLLGLLGLGLALKVRSLLPAVAVAWGLVAALLAIAFLFSFRYTTAIPARFGPLRMYEYVAVSFALLVGVVLEAGLDIVAAARRRVLAAVAVAVGALAAVAAVARVPDDPALMRRANAGLAAIGRVADVVPCEARMLVNARTAGTWEATTGRLALTEGHAPFLRPAVIDRVVPTIIAANSFFRDPEAHRDFLRQENIQYVVTVDPGIAIGAKGPRQPREGDEEAVAALPDVEPILRDPSVSVFAVDGAPRPSPGGEPDRCPL